MPSPSSPEDAAFRVLVIVARPLDVSDLPDIADQWALQRGLSAVQAHAHLHVLRPPTIDRLRTEILHGYDIVHFDGHGSASAICCQNCGHLSSPDKNKCERCNAVLDGVEPGSYLSFETEDGTQEALAAEKLADLLQAAPGDTKLVVLSACQSAQGKDGSVSAALRKSGVPAVLGMKERVGVNVTIAFSQTFYAALGAGKTIAEAFDMARLALRRLPANIKTGTPARDVLVLEGEENATRIVDHPTPGRISMKNEKIFGVPEYGFVGEHIFGQSPRGRKGLLARTTRALLDKETLVVLTGQGGIGKSVLASVAAKRMAWNYPGGVFWRSAADIKDLGLNELLDAFANVFGHEFRTLPVDAKRDIVLGRLRDLETSCLIVVDNAETITDPALWRFLEGIPQPSAALVTSRESLEREGRHIDVEQMEPKEAITLFVTEARQRAPEGGARLASFDENMLDKILVHLEGHPLGIKLAAALVWDYSLGMILDMLRRAPSKEVSRRFDFSYNTLSESESELLHRMAAFASSVTEKVIRLACAEPYFVGEDPLPGWQEDLSELVRKSFVDVQILCGLDESGNEIVLRCYRLHPLMRQYASGKAGKKAMAAHHRRAANLFLAYALQFSENYDALEDERENILAGMDWAYAAEEWEMVKRFVPAIDSYLRTRGYWNERRKQLKEAVRAGKELGERTFEAKSLHNLGVLAKATGDLAEARRLCEESLKMFQELGDKVGVAKLLAVMALLEETEGNLERALDLIRQAETLFIELGSPAAAQARKDRERLEKSIQDG